MMHGDDVSDNGDNGGGVSREHVALVKMVDYDDDDDSNDDDDGNCNYGN